MKSIAIAIKKVSDAPTNTSIAPAMAGLVTKIRKNTKTGKLLKTEPLSTLTLVTSVKMIKGDVRHKILNRTATSIPASSKTVTIGIVDKKTINMGTRRNHEIDAFQEGKITRDILQ